MCRLFSMQFAESEWTWLSSFEKKGKCSSGHVECSFDNPVEMFRSNSDKVFLKVRKKLWIYNCFSKKILPKCSLIYKNLSFDFVEWWNSLFSKSRKFSFSIRVSVGIISLGDEFQKKLYQIFPVCVRILGNRKCQECYEQLQISLFKLIIIQNYHLDFSHQEINRPIIFWGRLFNKKIFNFFL